MGMTPKKPIKFDTNGPHLKWDEDSSPNQVQKTGSKLGSLSRRGSEMGTRNVVSAPSLAPFKSTSKYKFLITQKEREPSLFLNKT